MRRRIALRGGEIRTIDGDVASQAKDSIDVVIVNAAPVARYYYSETFDPNVAKAPICWSGDTQRPSSDIPDDQKQSSRCMDCPQNVRGSGSFGGRACRFSQRLAVTLTEDPSVVYRLQIPATSIYGRGNNGNMPLQEYVKFLSARGSNTTGIVTRVYLDEESAVPKLFFKPIRSLNEEELDVADQMISHSDTVTAIQTDEYTVAQVTSPFDEVDGFEFDAN
jgi:hypothetical protein